ncbi:outer membrane protein assembly factor BamA [Acidibrevibacterium sp.]|uniref:outer membrane protein assembly factor BamA n=1 Tax=Acidibrevibacterium sp. TaxID=2606776 RepID=UPI003D07DF6B
MLAGRAWLAAPAVAQESAVPGPVAPPIAAPPAEKPPEKATSPAANPAPEAAEPPPVIVHPVNPHDLIQSIVVQGNKRIETGTVLSYMVLQPGDPFDVDRMDRSLKTLYATGLFSDVNIRREGNNLVVSVTENPLVNRVAFEGNKKLTDDQLKGAIQLRQNAVFTATEAQADRKKLLDLYAQNGKFAASIVAQIIKQPENRVDVIFKIDEGPTSLISRIAFVGNHAFSSGTLLNVISSREHQWWLFLSSSDTYAPERIAYDKELLRKFYLKNGYADFAVTGANAELSPDRQAFFLTFTLHEGDRYKVAKITVDSRFPKISGDSLLPDVRLRPGDYYNGNAVEDSVKAISADVQSRGEPFVEVKPRISRDEKAHTVALIFDVDSGPRVYVERIDIVGNNRTEDQVIRRQFTFAEGDAFSQDKLTATQQNLKGLNFFDNVNVTNAPGSSPDQTIVTAQVQDKPTGSLSLGGGYSTDIGPLLNVGVSENNFLGTGMSAGVNAIIAELETSESINFTDPYFLGDNLLAGINLFHVDNNFAYFAEYSERRTGAAINIAYQFNDHFRQSWTYTYANREVYNVYNGASYYIQDQSGQSILSQFGQVFTMDYRDNPVDPHSGFVVRAGTDYAGPALGGQADFDRVHLDAQQILPLDFLTGNNQWALSFIQSGGYINSLNGQPTFLEDRFYLGGQNLRGFLDGGVGPHDPYTGDSLGGNLMWTASTELWFPLPVSPDLGLSGRIFTDMGALSGLQEAGVGGRPVAVAADGGFVTGRTVNFRGQVLNSQMWTNDGSIRLSAGVGLTWNSPFGLINLDIGEPIIMYKYDMTELFRVGFGTRF